MGLPAPDRKRKTYDIQDDRRFQELEARLAATADALQRIGDNAQSWHGDDAAKGRALTVIAGWSEAALRGSGTHKPPEGAALPDKPALAWAKQKKAGSQSD